MKTLLTLILTFISFNLFALTFHKNAEVSAEIADTDAVCIYLMNGYRPVTPSAVDAVRGVGSKSCNDKAEARLFKKTGKQFIKHNKKTLGTSRYNEIKTMYYKFLSGK
jgi:hypothetical protein